MKNILKLYNGKEKITIIQGDNDDTFPIKDSYKFKEKNVILKKN